MPKSLYIDLNNIYKLTGGGKMVISIGVAGLISSLITILFGVIIIVWKKSLNYLIGFYFLLVGILGLLAAF